MEDLHIQNHVLKAEKSYSTVPCNPAKVAAHISYWDTSLCYVQCTKHALLSQITLQVLCDCLFRRDGVCSCCWTSQRQFECQCYQTGGAHPAGNSSAAPVPALGSSMERLPQLRQTGSSPGLQSSTEHSYCKEKPTLWLFHFLLVTNTAFIWKPPSLLAEWE